MKKICIIALALVCNCLYLKAEQLAPTDTLNLYVIDNQAVENFDGTQLEGRTILSYRTSTTDTKEGGVITVHYIRTEDTTPLTNPVYVIDGKQVTKKKYERLKPKDIKTITVVKNGSQEVVKQYPGWENGVILVQTLGRGEQRDQQVDIGYGKADRKELSYSVSTIKAEENGFYSNMYEYLRGKVPGVQVAPDNTIVIRGVGTFNSSTTPLILVDGVEINDLSTVNPRDVYNVDVLKDASSSIYGMKGANGVILITTRTGQKSKK